MTTSREIITDSPDSTRALAARLADRLTPGDVVALHGELGSGKTCFSQGLAAGLGIDAPVTSPTYTIINEYDSDPPFYHIDLYRLRNEDEACHAGVAECLTAGGIAVVEWADRAPGLFPATTITCTFNAGDADNMRQIKISVPTTHGLDVSEL